MNRLLTLLLSSCLGGALLTTSLSHATTITETLNENQSIALNFHDVRDDVLKQGDRDIYAVNTKNLAEFFDWLSHSKWHPVTLKQIMDARLGKSKLPENAILLSFDDGILSSYTRVYPLLKQYKLPATFAIVTSWTEGRNDGGEQAYGKNNFMTWAQMQEMQQSGLVEFASHSDSLHQGILANPQGNEEPSAITRQYLKDLHRYETDQEFEDRISQDLVKSKSLLEQHLGVKVDAIIWPYGAVTPEIEKIANDIGLPLSFSLGRSGINSVNDGTLKRLLITNNPDTEGLHQELINLINYPEELNPEVIHSIHLDLDDLSTLHLSEEEQKLGTLLERLKAMAVPFIVVDAVHSEQNQWKAYFPNHELPVKKDILNRFIWQAKTRIHSNVLINLPFVFQHRQLKGLVIDVMKNNTGAGGLQFDFNNQFQKLWNNPQDPQLQSDLVHKLNTLNQLKNMASYYSNISGTFKISIHHTLDFNKHTQIEVLLEQMLKSVDLVNLTINMPLQKSEQQALLKQLSHLDVTVKQKLMISFDLQKAPQADELKQIQKLMLLLQQTGIQNIGINHYQLQNSQAVQNFLYMPLSLNNSPLTYENPFKLEPYKVEK